MELWGGWIEGEENLDQECFCWVADEACVYGGASVIEGALIYGNAKVSGSSVMVGGLARVFGYARIKADDNNGIVDILGNALIFGNTLIRNGRIYENAEISGNTSIDGCGAISIGGNAKIHGGAHVANYESLYETTLTIDGYVTICDMAKILCYGFGAISISGGTIDGNAKIMDGACSFGGHVGGEAQISDSAIFDDAKILGRSFIRRGSEIHGDAHVQPSENCAVYLDGVRIGEGAWITSSNDYCRYQLPSYERGVFFFLTKDLKIEMLYGYGRLCTTYLLGDICTLDMNRIEMLFRKDGWAEHLIAELFSAISFAKMIFETRLKNGWLLGARNEPETVPRGGSDDVAKDKNESLPSLAINIA